LVKLVAVNTTLNRFLFNQFMQLLCHMLFIKITIKNHHVI